MMKSMMKANIIQIMLYFTDEKVIFYISLVTLQLLKYTVYSSNISKYFADLYIHVK